MIAGFSQHYGINFRRPELLKLALTHRSYLSVTGQGPRESNERLEYLGDSVLGLVTSEFLYREHPSEHEGQLTKTKSLLVSKAILSRRALGMGLGRFVLMSHSEVESGGRQRLSILADAFEAVIGAIYLDQGFEAAREFIARWLLRDSREIVADKRHTNYKSHLQEYVQSTYRTHPVYRIRSEMGPDHSKQFNVEVLVGRRTLGVGKGRNKKDAEQAAARDALENVEGSPGGRPTRERRNPPPEPPTQTKTAEVPGTETAPEPARRRRGRRGGRGRHPRESEPPSEEQDRASGAAEPKIDPGAPTPRSRPAAPASGRLVARPEPKRTAPRPEAQPPAAEEIEPPPTRREEDEYEEVGRPEGPLEERHVDPYATDWAGPSSTAPSTAPEHGSDVGESLPGFRDFEAGLKGGRTSAVRPEDEGEPSASFPEDQPAEEHRPQEAGGARPSPRYGRRGGRGRRGPR